MVRKGYEQHIPHMHSYVHFPSYLQKNCRTVKVQQSGERGETNDDNFRRREYMQKTLEAR